MSQVIQVTDSSGQAVPYATVEVPKKNAAYFTDVKGRLSSASLHADDSDTLVISSIGFRTLRMLRGRISGRVILERQVKLLPEVFAYNGNWKKVNLGTTDKGLERNSAFPFKLLNGPGQQIGRMIYPELAGKENVFIERISFLYLLADSSKAPVRLRVYAIDENGKPGEDLLTESMVRLMQKDRGWLEFDLRENPLRMPPKGVCVAVEYFDADSVYWHKDSSWHMTDSTGKLLRYTQNILGGGFRSDDHGKNCLTYWRKNGEWILNEDRWLIKPYDCYNLVVKVWVKYPK